MKNCKSLFKSLGVASLGIIAVIGTASAQSFSSSTTIPNYPGGGDGTPLAIGGELIANGGDVSVTYLGLGGASYDEQLYINTVGGNNLTGTPLIDNQSTAAGTKVDLGSFTAGTEVLFSIFVDNTGNTWFDGPGSRNADGAVHAFTINDFSYTINTGVNSGETGDGTYVGFEDESYPGGDFNYADLQFDFNGVEGVPAPDAASTMSLLGLSLAGLGMVGRRFKK